MLPILQYTPRTTPCRAANIYDSEAQLFCAAFEHDEPPSSPTLATIINKHHRISTPPARLIVGGDIDILYSMTGRLSSIEIYTTRSHWRPRELTVPPSPPVWFTPLVEFDNNNICSLPAELVTLHAHRRLAFASFWPPPRWLQLADNVSVGVDAESRIVAFLFTDCIGL